LAWKLSVGFVLLRDLQVELNVENAGDAP